jgi:hypothetical protein
VEYILRKRIEVNLPSIVVVRSPMNVFREQRKVRILNLGNVLPLQLMLELGNIKMEERWYSKQNKMLWML